MDVQNVRWERFNEIVSSADQIWVTSAANILEDVEYRFWTFLKDFSDENEIQFLATDNDDFFVVTKQEVGFDGEYFLVSCDSVQYRMKFLKVTTTPILP